MSERSVPGLFPFCPIPSALLAFRTGDRAQILATGWVGVICSRPALLSITLKRSPDQPCGLPPKGDFSINLPREELLSTALYRELLVREELVLLDRLGLSLQSGVGTAAPVIAECQIRIECRRATFSSRFGQKVVSGEVVAVHVDNEVFGMETPLDLCRLKPFTRRLPLPRLPHQPGIPELPPLEGPPAVSGFSLS